MDRRGDPFGHRLILSPGIFRAISQAVRCGQTQGALERSPPMSAGLQAVCEPQTRCKCCGGQAFVYGVVDFHKNCENRRGTLLEMSGVPIYYHQCMDCPVPLHDGLRRVRHRGLSSRHLQRDYALVDPDYHDARPRANASVLLQLFSSTRPRRLLDYGGGNGVLANLLREAGFPLGGNLRSVRSAVLASGRKAGSIASSASRSSSTPPIRRGCWRS